MMFCKLHLWLQSGCRLHAAKRSIHKLASLQKATTLSPKEMQSLLYPFSELDAYLDRSVDRTPFQLFHPSLEVMIEAEKLFYSSPSHKIDYYMSAERMDHAPALMPPEGHTKKMNFFRVGRAFTIVDMPGYGHRAPRDFVDMVEPYLYTRKNLVRTFLLVDGSVGLQKADLIALEMCEEIRCPYVIVVTKIDRCRPGVLLMNLLKLQDVVRTETTSCFPQPFLIRSRATGCLIEILLSFSLPQLCPLLGDLPAQVLHRSCNRKHPIERHL
ncbi:GTP-binding protein 8 isoform X3 [Melanotaenia boesemani]|uniref:GTP-binding protein 8 isoform X3 n=1 Tax=Melanotaenia boesemani TaxID=1250792 RepID=UPI001C05608D|nr:GTP-binding protein 8 isoform X3 [Melanotaenia boesemani]